MKKCPKCQKEVSEHAKQCPYCGTTFSGYQPISRNKKRRNPILGYVLLALFMVFAPLLLPMVLSGSMGNAPHTPSEQVTLGTLKKVDKDREKVEYIFDSPKEFSSKVKGGSKYTDKIADFEKNLKEIVNKHEKASVQPAYEIYVTKANNVFFYLTYDIEINTKHTMTLHFEYDITGRTNEVNVTSYIHGFTDFESMKIVENRYAVYPEILTLINGNKKQPLFNKTSEAFNKLEKDFESRKDRLGNYGVGVSKDSKSDQFHIRILSREDTYTLKLSYDTSLAKDILY